MMYKWKKRNTTSVKTTTEPSELRVFFHGQLTETSNKAHHNAIAQKAFFNADTGNAFTTVLAGLAFTMTTLPKTSLLPALVAGFKRVLIMHKPGSTNLPALFTCCVPISAKLFTAFAHTAFFSSVLSESA